VRVGHRLVTLDAVPTAKKCHQAQEIGANHLYSIGFILAFFELLDDFSENLCDLSITEFRLEADFIGIKMVGKTKASVDDEIIIPKLGGRGKGMQAVGIDDENVILFDCEMLIVIDDGSCSVEHEDQLDIFVPVACVGLSVRGATTFTADQGKLSVLKRMGFIKTHRFSFQRKRKVVLKRWKNKGNFLSFIAFIIQ